MNTDALSKAPTLKQLLIRLTNRAETLKAMTLRVKDNEQKLVDLSQRFLEHLNSLKAKHAEQKITNSQLAENLTKILDELTVEIEANPTNTDISRLSNTLATELTPGLESKSTDSTDSTDSTGFTGDIDKIRKELSTRASGAASAAQEAAAKAIKKISNIVSPTPSSEKLPNQQGGYKYNQAINLSKKNLRITRKTGKSKKKSARKSARNSARKSARNSTRKSRKKRNM